MGRFDPFIRRAFFGAVLVWAAVLFLAPLLTKAATATGDVAALAVYVVGSIVCHQRPERSFHVFGVQMPVCARCTGIYLGAAAAAIAAAVATRRKVRTPVGPWLATQLPLAVVVSVVPALLTLVYEWSTGDMPSNGLRAASGVPMGAVVSWLVLRPVDDAQARPVWVEGRVH